MRLHSGRPRLRVCIHRSTSDRSPGSVSRSRCSSGTRGSRQAFGHFGLINARIYTDLIQNARQEVRLTLDLNNLTDRQYRMPFDFRDPGFNAFVGVDVRY